MSGLWKDTSQRPQRCSHHGAVAAAQMKLVDNALEPGGAFDGVLPTTISQVTACSHSWKEPSVQKGSRSARTGTCSSDLFCEHIGPGVFQRMA